MTLVQQEINNLPYQFRSNDNGDNANLHSLLSAFLQPFENVGNVLTEQSILDINNSTGSSLDVIGKLLDFEREGRTDDQYRLMLKLKSNLNNANGTLDFTISAIQKSLQTNQAFYVEETARLVLYLNLIQSIQPTELELIRNTIVAGVKLTLYYTINDPIYTVQEEFKNFQTADGYDFLIGAENAYENLLISDVGEGSSFFSRALKIGDGAQDLLIDGGSLLITYFDEA